MLITASSKTLSFFNKDTRGEVQTVTFDTDEVKTLFYGSFHKVKTSDYLVIYRKNIMQRFKFIHFII